MEPSSSLLTVFEGIIFDERDDSRQDIRERDPVNILMSAENGQNLPAGFLKIADKLHQTYLDWKHRRDRYQPTQTTFYRYIHQKIERAAAKVAESGTPLEPPIFLILEAKIAFLTLNSSLMAAQDYLKIGYLQDVKESVDTALSVLYELIKTREKLEPSLEAAVASIRQDITNDPETYQFVAYVATQISQLRDSIGEPKLYIVRSQLDKLKDTLTLLRSADGNSRLSKSDKLDDLMTRLLWAMADENIYTTTITHQHRVWRVSFSPDGTYLANASRDKTAQLVEVATGRVVTTITHQDLVWRVSFSPDGTYLATASWDKTAQLVAVATGRVVTTITHKNSVNDVSFSPDGTYLATSSGKTAQVVEVATGRVVTTITHESLVNDVSFSPDGTYLATASGDKTAQLVEVATGRVVTTITHQAWVWRVSFSPDGAYLATASWDKTAQLVEVATSRVVTTIRHQDVVKSVSFSPDGTYLATASEDKTAKLVAVATGRVVTTIRHQDVVYSVSFSPDGTYLATSTEVTSKLVEVTTGRVVTTITQVNDVSFSPDGTYLATASRDKTVKLVEVATGRVVTTIRHRDVVYSVSFSPDGTYLATASYDKTAKLINLRKLSQLLKEQNNPSLTPQPEISAIVHLNKPEAFFLGWLRIEANRYSFYDYMLEQATRQELSVRYHSPVLETNLLLQSLGFLLINAEKHYQTVYPTLIGIDETEIHVIAMQDMKHSISATLSTLYEFIAQRMELDKQDYNRSMASFQGEIEEQIDNTDLLIQIYYKLQSLLQLEGIKTTGELQTIKDMLLEIDRIFKQLLPEEMRTKIEAPVIPVKKQIEKTEIMNLVDEAEEANLIPLLTNLNNLGLLNPIVALAAMRKISPQRLLELCRLLPQTAIDKEVAIAAINQRRKTYYISTFSEFGDIIDKETLIKLLESSPPKTWWRR